LVYGRDLDSVAIPPLMVKGAKKVPPTRWQPGRGVPVPGRHMTPTEMT
jgi:hypothetical protein